ncbi:MAG: hypothetical protein IKQ67_02910 [Candidatus Methanomethylophilaceae archaeon]|nr:hypothetical protein [Candidatus Methanomethylophilaceae archaeon]
MTPSAETTTRRKKEARTTNPESDDHSFAVDYISAMEHGVIIAVGSGKQGKSCSLHSLLAYCHPDRPKYLLDTLDFDVSVFPGYRLVSKTSDIPVGSAVVIEDVNRIFQSRGSSKRGDIQGWLSIISHKSIIIAITTQNLADTDIAFLRSQDAIVMNKWMHHEDLQFERPEFRFQQSAANDAIDLANAMNPDVDRRAWCYFPRFEEVVSIPKVDWWSYANSHMFRDVVV